MNALEKQEGSKSLEEIEKLTPSERVDWLDTLQPKFRAYPLDYTSLKWGEVQDLLFACSYQIGVTNPPEPEMLQKMCAALKTQSPDTNVSEINEAFDLYAFQKLDFKTPHYNSFDLLFLANIVTSYKRYKASVRMKSNLVQKKIEVAKPQKQESKHDFTRAIDFFKQSLFAQFQQYKKDKIYNWSELDEKLMYLYLQELGIINLTVDEKKDIHKKVIQDLRMNIGTMVMKGYAKKDKQSGEFTFEKFYVEKKCHSAAVRRFIEMSDFEEVDMVELIKNAVKNNG